MPDGRHLLAFSPGSITCFFHVERGQSPQTTVSHGCAINIEQGVSAALSDSATSCVTFNDQPIGLPTVDQIIQELAPRPVAVHLESPLPIGCGFGVSASSALAVAFAINRYFGLRRTREELGMLAHVAEVLCGTGVGDVAAQMCGGVVYRRCRRGPFDCRRLPVSRCPLAYVVFGPLSTRETLKSETTIQAINREGRQACRWLEDQTQPSVPAILRRSRQFATNVGLVTEEVQEAIRMAAACDQEATMILLGQSAVAAGEQPPSEAWTPTTIDEQGTRLLA